MTKQASTANKAAPTTKKQPTLKQLETRIIALEKENKQMRDLIEAVSKEGSANLGRMLMALGKTIGRQGTSIVDSVYPPVFSIRLVNGEEEQKNDMSLGLILEESGDFTVMTRGEGNALVPVNKEEIKHLPFDEFIEENSLVAGKLVWVNTYRSEGV